MEGRRRRRDTEKVGTSQLHQIHYRDVSASAGDKETAAESMSSLQWVGSAEEPMAST